MKHQFHNIPTSARLLVTATELAESAEKGCFSHVALLARLIAEQRELEKKSLGKKEREERRREQETQAVKTMIEQDERRERKERIAVQCNSHIIAYHEHISQIARERAEAERSEKARVRSLVRDGKRRARAEHNQREQDRINRFPALAEWRADYAETKENKRIRHILTTYRVTEKPNEAITASGVEYMRKASRIMAYTAIKTAYQQSAHPFLYTLMQSAYADRKAESFRETRETVGQAQELKRRKRKKVAGVWLRSDDEYLSFTDEAKENLLAVDVKAESRSADYDDCVQEAFETLWKMSADMVSFADVWNYRIYAYRAVNSYIMKQRKAWDENQRMRMTEYADNGEERVISEREFTETVTVNLGNDYIMECVADVIMENLACRKDTKTKIRKSFLMSKVNGMSTNDIARVIDVDVRSVQRYIERAEETARLPDVRQEIYNIVKN